MKVPQDYIDELVSELRSSEYLTDKADPGCKLALILGQAHRMIRTLVEEIKASKATPDREDLRRELDVATDHPRAFAEAILDSKPEIFMWLRHRIVFSFDKPEQASAVFDLLQHAINSVKPASTGEGE